MLLSRFHQIVGLALGGLFLGISLAGLGCWISNRDPGSWFWRLLAAAQAGLGVQLLAGAAMLALRGNRSILHYVYGGFPVLVLLFTHRASRKLKGLEWAAFAAASFFIFGLQLRGYMTGKNPG